MCVCVYIYVFIPYKRDELERNSLPEEGMSSLMDGLRRLRQNQTRIPIPNTASTINGVAADTLMVTLSDVIESIEIQCR